MTIHEKIRTIGTATGTPLWDLIGARVFLTEAPQGCTVPYVVYRMAQDSITTQNGPRARMRPWFLYLYPFAEKPLMTQRIGVQLEAVFCDYKRTVDGAADTDIQGFIIDTGIVDLDPVPRTGDSKLYPAALVLKVWEQIGV